MSSRTEFHRSGHFREQWGPPLKSLRPYVRFGTPSRSPEGGGPARKSTRTTTTRLEWHRWKGCQPPSPPLPAKPSLEQRGATFFLLEFLLGEGGRGERVLSARAEGENRTSSSDCQPVIACQLLAFRVIKLIWRRRVNWMDQVWPVFPFFPRNFPGGFREPLSRALCQPPSGQLRVQTTISIDGPTGWPLSIDHCLRTEGVCVFALATEGGGNRWRVSL